MKKLTRKLFLSVAALAVCAATLVSTTFAWYVSNSTAEIGATAGSTAGTEVSGNLLVADATRAVDQETGKITYTEGSYKQKLDTVAQHTAVALNPVTKDTETIKPADNATGWHDVDLNPVATTAAYSEFSFYVLSTKATTVNIKFGVANNTTEFKSQTLYNTEGKPTDIDLNETFYKDAVEALRIEIFQISAEAAATEYTGATSLGVFEVSDFQNAECTADYTPVSTAAAGGNAQTYYTAVMGKAPAGGTAEVEGTTVPTTLTVEANKGSLLVFRYWLEGTDGDCFDSCIAQTFAFNFKLEAAQN